MNYQTKIAQLLTDDKHAMKELYHEVYHWALKKYYKGRPALAKDETQEAITTFTTKAKFREYDVTINPIAYIKGIIHYRYLNFFKDNRIYIRKKYRTDKNISYDSLKFTTLDLVDLEKYTVPEELEIKNDTEMQDCLSRLACNPKSKECLDLLMDKYGYEQSNETINEKLKLSTPEAVSVKISRCKRKIQAILKKLGWKKSPNEKND